MVSEKKKMEAPPESRGVSKQKWIEERKKKIGKVLDANGLGMEKAYMLDTQEMAEAKYKKWEIWSGGSAVEGGAEPQPVCGQLRAGDGALHGRHRRRLLPFRRRPPCPPR